MTGQAFLTAAAALRQAGLQALIIDLRDNAGGDVAAAIEVADAFIEGGIEDEVLLVQQVSRQPGHNAMVAATATTTLPRWPVAVLVDSSTASAAEILAGALQDHRRALIVGEPTTGKESVQKLFVLDDGSGVRLTIARYLTPKGRNLAEQGLRPDIAVPITAVERYRAQRASRQATDDPGHDAALSADPQVLRARELLHAHLLLSSPSR